MPTFGELVAATQLLRQSKWFWDIHHYAERLGITVEEAYAFIKAAEKGGTGTRSDGSWVPNPAPFAAKIDLAKQEDNAFNFYYVDNGIKSSKAGAIFSEPSTASINQSTRYLRLGRASRQNNDVTIKLQKELIQYVVGTHQTLLRHWPDIAKFRQDNWRIWIENGANAAAYQSIHLPWIAVEFWNLWDVPVARGTAAADVTPTVLELVKLEIVELLVRMYILPESFLECTVLRRSRRNQMAVSDGESDVEIAADPSRKRTRVSLASTELSSDEEDEDDAGAGEAAQQFNLGTLKVSWDEGNYMDVARLEVALLGAHQGKPRTYVNAIINQYGGRTLAVAEYEAIKAISKSTIVRKLKNFVSLRDWINEGQRTKLFLVNKMEKQLLLSYVRQGCRFNDGDELTRELFEPTGPRELRSEVAFMIRHIHYVMPHIGLSRLPELFSYMYALIAGRPAVEDEIPSTATLRINIARLDHIDEYETTQKFLALAKARTPCGNPILMNLVTDDTCHGKFKKCHVVILTCDDLSLNDNHESDDPKEKWAISPFFILGTTSPAVTSNCEGNSDLNLETIQRFIPTEALGIVGGTATDNANDAIKEHRLNMSKWNALVQERGVATMHVRSGVVRRGIRSPDGFHIAQLGIKYMSEGAMGKTEKGNHGQTHHRQGIQVIWDVRKREVAWTDIVESIFAGHATKWRPKPRRELATRWRSNGLAGINILEGWYIQDADGTPSWVLLAQRLTYIYKESDWRVERLEHFIEMMLMPKVIFGLWVEAESLAFFDLHYDWHAQCGALSNRPGFRSLEYARAVVDHFFAWWQGALEDPESRYPQTFRFIKEYMEDKGKHEMAKEAKEQLLHGIKCAHDEIAKLCVELCTAPWIFTWLTCPTRGAIVLRVIIEVLREEQYDLDAVVDGEGILIDDGLEWGDLKAPEVRCETHQRFYDLLKPDAEALAHYWRELELDRSQLRDELKTLSQERGVHRNPNAGESFLFDFAKEYPQIFDMLHSKFARKAHASRIGESFHAVEKNAFNEQTSDDTADARGRYLIKNEYDNRRERRRAVYDRDGKGTAELKRAPKHNDRGYTVQLGGAQLHENAQLYTNHALAARIEDKDVLNHASVSAIKGRGTKARQKERQRKVAEHREAQRKKKLSSEKYNRTSLEEYQERADARSTEHDQRWRAQNTPEAIEMNTLKLVLTRKYWDKMKVCEGFWDELKAVLPLYWKLVHKEAKGKRISKSSVMKGTAPVKTNIATFLDQVTKIADGGANKLSTKTRAKQLKRAGASRATLMKEFVKYGLSEYLKKKEKEEAEKHKEMRGVMEICGTELKDEWQTDGINIERQTLSYHHPPAIDDADLIGEGADDLEASDDEEEEEDRAELSDSEMSESDDEDDDAGSESD